jgi:hypothetical protein
MAASGIPATRARPPSGVAALQRALGPATAVLVLALRSRRRPCGPGP